MKKTVLILMCLFLAGTAFTLKSQNLMTQDEKNSYALGFGAGENYKNLGLEKTDLNFEAFLQGFKEGFDGENKLSLEEMQACFMELQGRIEARQAVKETEQNAGAEIERERGRQFLADNKKSEGVIETASGLQYKVVVMGEGPKPAATNTVKVHYHGTTIDGVVFDSSVQRGQPIEFGLNQVIRGWTEGLQLMPVGSKFIFYIPNDLAYGNSSQGPVIKAGAALIFEVELLDIPK